MKQYKHPKLGIWKVIQQKFSDVYTDVNKFSIASPHGGQMNDVSTEELLALGFEEVVEEKEDWKLDLYESLEGLFGKGLDELEEFLAFRKKLETHMPKQKRFSQKYIDNYNTKNQRACISSFLRDHDLLEE